MDTALVVHCWNGLNWPNHIEIILTHIEAYIDASWWMHVLWSDIFTCLGIAEILPLWIMYNTYTWISSSFLPVASFSKHFLIPKYHRTLSWRFFNCSCRSGSWVTFCCVPTVRTPSINYKEHILGATWRYPPRPDPLTGTTTRAILRSRKQEENTLETWSKTNILSTKTAFADKINMAKILRLLAFKYRPVCKCLRLWNTTKTLTYRNSCSDCQNEGDRLVYRGSRFMESLCTCCSSRLSKCLLSVVLFMSCALQASDTPITTRIESM